MHKNIEKLMAGNANIPEYFVQASKKWEEVLADISSVSEEKLAERLSNIQFWFEQNCGGRWDGQEVMVWTAFASIYSTATGYDRAARGEAEARKLLNAFTKSMVSLEVKFGAKKAAASYFISQE
ncbi:hypothetical protein [Undibacterium flavidum]|uniref:Uncharacterized protein n=1 Tax=Undibacterium flavidum TaxID=2762297 RepID=A0ABR6YBG8_9BURK|nr:hypothetical protein [Undibacterium flavidum]MBC3873489.1 hypothetical protein [Undibacterium flavidum]